MTPSACPPNFLSVLSSYKILYDLFVQLSFTGHHTYGSPLHRRSDTKWEALGHTQPKSNTENEGGGGRKEEKEVQLKSEG